MNDRSPFAALQSLIAAETANKRLTAASVALSDRHIHLDMNWK